MISGRAENMINFENGDTLKAVYNAGLRPWITPNSTGRCSIGESVIGLDLPDGKSIANFPVQYGSFQVLADYSLTSASFSSGLIDLPTATETAIQIASSLGLSTAEITRLASEASPTTVSTPREWTGEVDFEKFKLRLLFTPVPRFSEVKGQTEVRIEWKRPMTGMRFWTEPMRPPPGYENESMAKPASTPPKGPQVPEHSQEYYESLTSAENEAEPDVAVSPAPIGQMPKQSSPPEDPTETPSLEPESDFPIIPVAVIAVLIVAGAVFFLRRKS